MIGAIGVASPDSNRISANSSSGVHIEGGSGHKILGNKVDAGNDSTIISGVNSNGTGTTGSGIRIDAGATDILVDGTKVVATNGINLAIRGPSAQVRVANTLIGGGSSHGILVGEAVTDLTIEDSTISYTGGAGIHLEGGAIPSGPVLIRHNNIDNNLIGINVVAGMGQVTIGTRRDATLPVSNKLVSNRDGGIAVTDPTARVRISGNAMQPIGLGGTTIPYAIPINLRPAGEAAGTVTPNDLLDADSGPNGLQNSPGITAVESLAGSNIRIRGTLNAKPSTTYVIEALQHTPALTGPTNVQTAFLAGYLGSANVTTDSTGNAAISIEVSGYTTGWRTALTATSPDGETSEYSNAETTGFEAPPFPMLDAQTAFSLPENESGTGSAFSVIRPAGATGAFNASISARASWPRDFTNPAVRPPLKYRLNATDAWINLNWETTALIPFTATENQRVIYLAAFDDTSWDPTNKPGRLAIYPGPGSFGKDVPLQFPDNDPPPVFTASNVPEFSSPPPIGPVPPPGYFENSGFDRIRIRFISDRPVSAYMDYRITVNAAQSTAVHGQDFRISSTTNPFTVGFTTTIFEASLTTTGFLVEPINDMLVEGDEIISFNIVSTTAGFPYSAVVPLTLRDDDFIQTTVADASTTEGNSGPKLLSFPVTLSQARAAYVTFDWVATAGAAASPSDFTAASGTVTIPSGATGASIPIEIIGDTAVETNETFTLTLSNPSAADVGIADGSAVGTITNDDFPSVSVADRTISEAAGTISLTATLSEPAPFASSVIYTLVNGTAVRPGDYTSASASGTLSFPAGTTTASVSVTMVNDTLVEPDETFTVQLSSPLSLTLGNSSATVTIQDNDRPSLLMPSVTSIVEGDTGSQTIPVTLTLNTAAIRAGSVNWQVTAASTAVEAASGTVSFPPGSTTASLSLTLPGNLTPQLVRSVRLQLSNPVEVTVPLTEITVATITDNDFPSVSVADRTISEAAGTISLTATLSEPAPFASSVIYTLVNGTAVRPGDYTAGTVSGTLSFPAGSTTASISLTMVNDTLVEPDETFTVQLSSPSSLTLGNSSATVTIQDNDRPSLLTPSVASIVEGDTGSQTIPVTLTLNTAAIRAGSVNWQVTADSTAVEAASGTASFAPGSTTASLSLTLPGNLIPHPARSVKLALSNPVEVSLPSTEITVATITDNDQRSLTGSGVSLFEGNGGTTIASFPISISAPLEVPVTVQYQTVDGTALAGSDYTAASGTATIPAGATGTNIPITILADSLLELNETFSLQLSAPVNATLGSVSLAGTIQNDDAQPRLEVSPATVTSGPGGPFLAWIEVKLPASAASLPIPVAYRVTTRDGTALAGTHYTPLSGGILTFPAGNGTPVSQWITVSVAGNPAGGVGTLSSFFVDFSTVSGPAAVVDTEVKIEPLRITDFSRLGSGFYTVSFPTGVAQNYVIQQASSLTGPWSDKTSVIPGTGNPVEEYLLFASQARAYFRVRSFSTPPANPAVLSALPTP